MRSEDRSEAQRGPEESDVERARETVENQLATREVSARAEDDAEGLVRVLEAVEGFERAVVAAGGDLMNNQISTTDPDNPDFVLPRRGDDEDAAAYERRVRAATNRVGQAD